MLTPPDIPFARDDANRFLPWMIALMCALAALMLCLALTLGRWAAIQQGDYGERFSVQLPDQGEKQSDTLRQALGVIEKFPGVKNASPMSGDAVRALVEPWLGDGPLMREIPMPAVIEVKRERNEQTGAPAPVDFEGLERRLEAVVPGASVDAQEAWAEKFSRLSRALQGGVTFLALCIGAALAGMMVFVSRAAMKLHASTVRLLHAIGADDRYIARQFQQNALSLSLRGAVPGTIAAAAVYGGLGIYTGTLDAPILPSLALTWEHVLLLIALPLASCLIAVIAVRFSALAELRRLP